MTNTITNYVIAITGASSGIGEATARLLAGRGAAVVLGARRTARLDRIAAEITAAGGSVATVAVDVGVRADLDRLVHTAVDRFGRLDVLVSNAGVAHLGPLADGDVDEWTAMIDVNVRGVLHGIAAAMPVFQRQGRGHFVTTVSTAGLRIVPTMGVYAATKNAVRTVMEALRQESTDGAVRTTSISPGYVRTDLSNMADFGLEPEAVARTVAFAIEQPHDVEIGEIVIRPTVQN
ncbi:SDR family oxidoreductase [Mycobacterium sp. NPDC048908]|uniref:SDR family oxidoreductase n=1 Tax=Mycobacterium sp. NPDC048908 TaxID=3364292 RepID=UPI0037201397